MIEIFLTICALTFTAPYYDCSEEWDIIVYDDSMDLLPCGTKKHSSLGCASYSRVFRNDRIELVHNHAKIMGEHTPKLKAGGILQHELLHLTCECNWHERWENDPTIRKHRFYHPIKVPETITPFLKDKWIPRGFE